MVPPISSVDDSNLNPSKCLKICQTIQDPVPASFLHSKIFEGFWTGRAQTNFGNLASKRIKSQGKHEERMSERENDLITYGIVASLVAVRWGVTSLELAISMKTSTQLLKHQHDWFRNLDQELAGWKRPDQLQCESIQRALEEAIKWWKHIVWSYHARVSQLFVRFWYGNGDLWGTHLVTRIAKRLESVSCVLMFDQEDTARAEMA